MESLEELPVIGNEHMSRRLKCCMHTNLWRTEINMLDVSAWE